MRLSLILGVIVFIFCFSANARETEDGGKYLLDSLPQRWEYYPSTDGKIISVDDKWWRNFEDDLLDSLVEMGLRANYDIRNAYRNLQIAHNTFKSARSAYFPTLSASLGWEKERISGVTQSRKGSAVNSSFWTGEAGLSWQIDLFGKITSQVNSKKSLWQASQAEWAGMMLSVAGEIVNEYISLRIAQAQLELLKQHAESQLTIVKMTEARKEAGVSSMLDVSQAKTVYYSTLASVPVYENTINTCINALAVLLAVYPDQLPHELKNMGDRLPAWQQMISTGIPMDLLRRRPDIVEAEKTVASYAAQLGLAKKDFLPTLTLDGTISTSAMHMGDLFTGPSFGYSIIPTLSWNFYTGGETTYEIRIARENLQSEIDTYNLTVATAVEETNNALSGYFTALKHIELIDDVVTWAQKSLTLSVDLYKDGLSSFTNVVDAQETLLEYETEAVTARSDALSSLVQIYTALGGGWDASNL
ncbi:MAG: TolC family protein [Muribaculaceae bacterium]|nr:TolC family protein [Muribaculaceae bacterium]